MRLHKLFEGYRVVPSIDKERYQERDGLEGPFRARNGKVYYYDPREGKAYDPDTDMYIDNDEYDAMQREAVDGDSAVGPDYEDPQGRFVVVSDGQKFFSLGIGQYGDALPLTDRGFRSVEDAVEDAEEMLGESLNEAPIERGSKEHLEYIAKKKHLERTMNHIITGDPSRGYTQSQFNAALKDPQKKAEYAKVKAEFDSVVNNAPKIITKRPVDPEAEASAGRYPKGSRKD